MVHARALSLSLPSSPPFLRSTPSATASSAHAVAPRRHTSASTTIHHRTHHQPCGNGPPPPLAPKWSHWALVHHIKRALRADGKDIRDYVEADQIDELFRRDVEERTRRERERSSPSTPDLVLKPNPHPYAIKTTHTALLSRSNSSGHNTPSKYFYVPSAGASSRSSTKHAHEYRGHRYSTSPTHPQRSESEDDALARRPRADTLPTYLADNNQTLSTEPKEDLPLNKRHGHPLNCPCT